MLEVFRGCPDPLREYLHSFATGGPAAHCAIRQVADGSVGEAKTGRQIVFTDRLFLPSRQGVCRNADRFGIEQPIEQVGKVASFAQDRAADRRIGHPIRAGNAG